MNDKFISHNELPVFPLCNSCKHYETGLKCKAFEIIPVSISGNRIIHDTILPGQKEPVVYEEKKSV